MIVSGERQKNIMRVPIATMLACVVAVTTNGCSAEPDFDRSTLPVMETAYAALVHQTDFLTGHDYTHLYPGRTERARRKIVSDMYRSGYTHIYVYVMNEGDYDGTKFNFYPQPFAYRDLLAGLVQEGLLPVVWLAPDDSPTLHAALTPERLMDVWNVFIPRIDQHVSSYVLGLEMDEYWTPQQQSALGAHLRTLTRKPIFVHMRPGLWKPVLEEWCDGIVYQYGFGESAAEVADITRSMLDRLSGTGKTFIAGEYSIRQSEEISRELGNAAFEAGASGFGNGGTPRYRLPTPRR